METVIVLNNATMGHGNDELGAKLRVNFFRTLLGIETKPDAIVFYNAAVRLLVAESPVLEALRQLEDGGVDLLACVTCLEFFGIEHNLTVGQVSNMREIVGRLMKAAKVVTI